MDIGRLVLTFGLVLAPPLAYGLFLVVYNHHRTARLRAMRRTVTHAVEHATRGDSEDAADSKAPSLTLKRQAGQSIEPRLEPEPNHAARLPPGWHWPNREPDDPPQAP